MFLSNRESRIYDSFSHNSFLVNYATHTMYTIVQQIKKVISALRQHFANANLDSPETVTLTEERTITCNKEVIDQTTFLDFHINIGTGTAVLNHACHCAASVNVVDMLKNIKSALQNNHTTATVERNLCYQYQMGNVFKKTKMFH